MSETSVLYDEPSNVKDLSKELKKEMRPVSEFNPKDIQGGERNKPFRMALYGKTCTGKSFCMKSMLYILKKRFDDVYLFCPTSKLQVDTYDYIPEQRKIETLDMELITQIMEKQMDQKMRDPKKLKHMLFIFDDMISKREIRNNPDVMKLFIAGRHYAISCIITSQNVGTNQAIPPELRNQCEYIVSFSLFSETDRKILIERFGSVTDKKDGVEQFKKITQEKYCCCVFDLTKTGANSLNDVMYRYKAPPKIPKFKMGKNELETKKNDEFAVTKGNAKFNIDFRMGKKVTQQKTQIRIV